MNSTHINFKEQHTRVFLNSTQAFCRHLSTFITVKACTDREIDIVGTFPDNESNHAHKY